MKTGYVIALILLAILTLFSLALNGVVLLGLLQAQRIALDAQQTTLEAVSDTRILVTSISEDTFSYTLTVEQEIPIATSIPFQEEVIVPVRTTIPISTTLIIPFNAGLLGTFDIDVPVRTLIPVNMELAVPISQTVDIATTVPLNVDIPVNIPLNETPLANYLIELDAALARLEEGLSRLGELVANPLAHRDD
ncbi:MAG TPA: hypothetical protein ENN99_04490 [Chloroflexi bacterium]|nr:hypothetical protein [Chloroflexota bacterium]